MTMSRMSHITLPDQKRATTKQHLPATFSQLFSLQASLLAPKLLQKIMNWGEDSLMHPSAHLDSFTRDNLPPLEQWPEFKFDLPNLQFGPTLNATKALLDDALTEGASDKVAIYNSHGNLTYSDLAKLVNKIAYILTDEFNFKPGNRLLIRGPNNPMFAAIFLACLKAGGVAVPTMPMLRSKELSTIIKKAQISHVITDSRLKEELLDAEEDCPEVQFSLTYGLDGILDALLDNASDQFTAVETASDDVAMLAFTSGTTGEPKACMHFHRDVMAMAETFSKHIVKPNGNDVMAGSPPLAFTFGLGGMLIFPLHARCSTVLDESIGPDGLLDAVETFNVTTLFPAPTAYRAILDNLQNRDISSVHTCVSAGETLPKVTSDAWFAKTGIRMIDGIGATEMIHIFISASGDDIRPGATGKPVPGYEACILDDNDQPLPAGGTGRLAVKGPPGCRYLADDRQKDYVINGWNVTGDTYTLDEDGYYWYQARSDDMIISSGYNIAGPEVENAALQHPAVSECAVVGAPDADRGTVVKAFIVLKDGFEGNDDLTKDIQTFIKGARAPDKYPRLVDYVDSLPKTQTGKLQRYKLKE